VRASVGVRRWAKTPPVSDLRAELRRNLRLWSLCKTFVHQFSLVAKRESPKKRTHGQWGDSGGRQPVGKQPKPSRGRAAVKHAQQVAECGRLAERQERAIGALAAVQAAARAEWPEDMKRELQSCRPPEQQQLWSEKWALHLAERVAGSLDRPWLFAPGVVDDEVAADPVHH
jgi:hypothetical protein